jgi:Co/Zn/Cd efflux system component
MGEWARHSSRFELGGTLRLHDAGRDWRGPHVFGSIALVADGMHMSTHASALLLATLAYSYSRKHIANSRFTFGSRYEYTIGLVVNQMAL